MRLPRVFACITLAGLLGCNQKPMDNRSDGQAGLSELDAKWSASSVNHDLDAVYSDDARLLPPDGPLTTGKAGRSLYT